ncbi:MAG: hypothetical protein QOD26_3824 [Betaproteobacteria bacterium]|nr:hypothetical protein [Betaproteobacteria bacterium]
MAKPEDKEGLSARLPAARTLSAIERLGVWYGNTPMARAAVHAVPIAGGALDALLEGAGARLKEERVLEFIASLAKELADTARTCR